MFSLHLLYIPLQAFQGVKSSTSENNVLQNQYIKHIEAQKFTMHTFG